MDLEPKQKARNISTNSINMYVRRIRMLYNKKNVAIKAYSSNVGTAYLAFCEGYSRLRNVIAHQI